MENKASQNITEKFIVSPQSVPILFNKIKRRYLLGCEAHN